ncbi:MAG: DEAD/DEAH box helicase [Nitrospira sp.]|nr:DEAD/DEAH box helicase [bacterium]MBL7048534.1 DEAD/DEAH box helicase [Nitrospira sp.]
MRFDQYKIAQEIKKNLEALGFKRPTDIQFKAIPSIMNEEDVMAVAQTGTGKTAAFAIPLINKIHVRKSSKRVEGIKCLVMVPTRELAMQIGEVFRTLSDHTRVKTFALYGGVEQDAQISRLQKGIDVVIATPGRMFDLISQGHLDISAIETLVLDEADQMLDLGFINDIEFIKRKLVRRHQTLFFSATINSAIKKLAFSQVKSSAIRIQISPQDPVAKNVSHYVMFVEMDDKRFFLERFITDNPEHKIMIFVRTKVRAERVAKAMQRAEITTSVIHGGKEQLERSEVIKSFKAGQCRILIATDVSARGIDIPDVNCVINYDMPTKAENYVHRVGRTGRGVKKGDAISFCSTEEKPLLLEIQEFINNEIEVIKIAKNEYAGVIEPPDEDKSIEELIEEQKRWEKKHKKKINKKKKN